MQFVQNFLPIFPLLKFTCRIFLAVFNYAFAGIGYRG